MDFDNFLGNLNNIVVFSIFKKCYNIVGSIWVIGRYFFGKVSIGLYFFFEIYYEKDGYYRG